MANLQRVTAKIFADNAPADKIGQFGSALAGTKVNTSDVSQIQALAAYENGWSSAVVSARNYPTLEETNGLMKVMSYHTAYLLQKGIAEWDVNTEYYSTSYVQYEGVLYKSLTDLNIGNIPSTSTTNWVVIPLIDDLKLEAQKAYLTGNILTDSKGYQEVVGLSTSTFDLAKFEVVGAPIISNIGVASGFTSNAYITASDIPLGKDFIFRFPVKANSFIRNQQFIRGVNSSNAFIIGCYIYKEGIIEASLNDQEGNYFVLQSATNFIRLNVDYYIEYKLENGVFTFSYSMDGINYNVIGTRETALNMPTLASLSFGTGVSGTSLDGLIDLKSIRIISNGQLVFSGAKTGLDVIKPDNYEVVGSPTITNDGIISGFSATNYIKSPQINAGAIKNIRFRGKTIVQNVLTKNNALFQTDTPTDTSNNAYAFMLVAQTTGYFYLEYYEDNVWKAIAIGTLGIPQVGSVIEYDVTLGSGSQVFNIKVNGQLHTVTTNAELLNPVVSQVKISSSNSYYSENPIDLNSIKIYTDGKLVYQPCLKIPYTLSKTGSKIVDVSCRDRVQDLYDQFGEALYYTLDEENQNYTIPMGEVYGMIANTQTTQRELGEFFYSTIPLDSPNYMQPNGSLLTKDGLYADFVEKMARLYDNNPASEYFTTEADWQNEVSAHGKCGKYVYDATAQTIRLPKIEGFIEATLEQAQLGTFTAAGLPNITGGFGATPNYQGQAASWGATIREGHVFDIAGGSGLPCANYTLNASRSSSVYKDGFTTVQPESIKLFPYIVVATNGVRKTSYANLDNLAVEIYNKANKDFSNVPADKGFLVESYVNGTSWYRVYSDGWCEQGGRSTSNGQSDVTVSFLKTFKDTNYCILKQPGLNSSSTTSLQWGSFWSKTTSSAITKQYDVGENHWYACGYIS